jgi:hypothetical protein
MDEKKPAQAGITANLDFEAWLSSLLFPLPGAVKQAHSARQVSQHLPRHWFQRLLARCGF